MKTDKVEQNLDEIANYPVPFYTIEGQQYVKLSAIAYLKSLAKDALKELDRRRRRLEKSSGQTKLVRESNRNT